MTKEELFRMAVSMTEQFVANRDIGGRTYNPEDAVHDYIVNMHNAIRRAWIEVGTEGDETPH